MAGTLCSAFALPKLPLTIALDGGDLQINIYLVVNIAFIVMASEFEEKKPGERSGAELWPSSGLGMGGPGAPGARLGGAGLSGAAVVGLKLTLSSKSVTLMRLMSPTVREGINSLRAKISPMRSGARVGCGEQLADEVEVGIPEEGNLSGLLN